MRQIFDYIVSGILAELSLTLIFTYNCPPTLATVSPRSHSNIHYVYAIFGLPLLPLTLIHFESWWTPPLHTCYLKISFGDPERSTKAQPNWTWTVGELQGSVFPPLIFLFQFVRVTQRFSLKPLVLPVHFGQLPCLKVKLCESDSGSWGCPLHPDPSVILHISQFLYMTSFLLTDTEKHQLSCEMSHLPIRSRILMLSENLLYSICSLARCVSIYPVFVFQFYQVCQ